MLYLWLLLTVVLVALSRGEVPVESAVWLAPVFLLRFTRSAESRGVVALAIPALALGHVIGTWTGGFMDGWEPLRVLWFSPRRWCFSIG